MERRSSSQLWATTTFSSGSVTRLSSQAGSTSAGLAGWRSSPRIRSWAAAPKTTHSSSELLASRFAPCNPVQVHSPTA